jgi:hypothetical protein
LRRGDLGALTIGLLAALAAGLCLYMLSRPGMLFGVTEYDDAVYFGSAVRLVHGVIPYRDFYLVQPPGLVVLLTPFAWLSDAIGTRDGLAVGRLFMPVVAAAQVLLVGKLVRHKGLAATLVGCAAMALYTDAITSSHTIELEPVLDLFCLGALAVSFESGRLRPGDRRPLIAGVLIGIGGAVKLLAVVPALVFAVIYVYRRGWAAGVRFVAGTLIGFGALVLPFVALDPSGFLRQVIEVQLNRQLPYRTPLMLRLSHMLGLAGFSTSYIGHTASLAAIILVGVILVVVLGLGYFTAARRGIAELDILALITAVLVFVMFLVPAEFYYHYGDLLAPFLALTVAAAVGGLAAAAPAALKTRAREAVIGIVAVLAVAVAAVGQFSATSLLAGADTSGAVDSVVPSGACVLSDSPALLVTADRLVAAQPGCPQIVDALGVSLSVDDGASPAILKSVTPQLAQDWVRLIGESDYVVLSNAAGLRIPFVPAVSGELLASFSRRVDEGIVFFVRKGYPTN